MTTRDQLNEEKLDALLDQLSELQNLGVFRQLRNVREIDEAAAQKQSRSKEVTAIVADYQTARGGFDAAVSDYSSASTATEQFTAVVDGVTALQNQVDEIVEYLVLTREDL
jgi:hypothetical protein